MNLEFVKHRILPGFPATIVIAFLTFIGFATFENLYLVVIAICITVLMCAFMYYMLNQKQQFEVVTLLNLTCATYTFAMFVVNIFD